MRPCLADVFAGSGRVGTSAESLGAMALTWELKRGEEHDLSKWHVEQDFHGRVARGEIAAASLAPPCQSFSIANNSSGPIRSTSRPRGLPGLPLHKELKVQQGNRLLRATIRMIHSLGKQGIPFSIEQPRTSYMWQDRRLQQALTLYGVYYADIDMCAFKTRYRKATRIALCFVQDPGILGDERRCRCHGRHGVCSFSHKQHVWLEGASTTRAAECPWPLAQALAKALLS